MARSIVALLLLGAALAALASVAAAAECATGVTIPGCAVCEKLTAEQIAAKQAAMAAKKAEWEAKKAAKGVTAAARKWDGKKDGKDWPGKDYKCTACAEGPYVLVKDHCVCKPGFGIPIPPKPTDGSRPAFTFQCTECGPGFASGPDAPKPTRPAHKPAPTTPRRHLLGGGHHGFHSVCVKCPTGKDSNVDHTKCE